MNKIKLLIKNREYNAALETINNTLKIEPTEELFFYKAYTLGELDFIPECIEQYKVLIDKNENEKYLQGMVRVLDKKMNIDESLIDYYIKLNNYDIKPERREINNERILKYSNDNDEWLFNNICIILKYRVMDNEDYSLIRDNILFLRVLAKYEQAEEYLNKIFRFRFEEYIKDDAHLLLSTHEKIRKYREVVYGNKMTENILKYDFFEYILYKMEKLYIFYSDELSDEILCDLFIILNLLNKDPLCEDNNIWAILNKLLTVYKNPCINYVNLHFKYLEEYFTHKDKYLLFIKNNIDKLLVFIFDFYTTNGFLIKRKWEINHATISINQKYFSPTIQIIKGIKHKSEISSYYVCQAETTNIYVMRSYYDSRSFTKFEKALICSELKSFEYFYYCIFFNKYNSTLRGYLNIIEEFIVKSDISEYNNSMLDFTVLFDYLIDIHQNSEELTQIDYTTVFFEPKVSRYWINGIILEIMCYILDDGFICNIKELLKYEIFISLIQEPEYQAMVLFFKYKLTGDVEYLEESLKSEIINFFAYKDYITYLLCDDNNERVKKYLKEVIRLQNIYIDEYNREAPDENDRCLDEIVSCYVLELSEIYSSEGNNEKALLILEENERYEKDYFLRLGALYYKFKKFNYSESCLNKAKAMESSFPCCYFLSLIYFETKRTNMAIQVLNETEHSNIFASIEKIRFLNKLKKHDEASKVFHTLNELSDKEMSPEDESLFQEIVDYEQLKLYVSIFEESGIVDPHMNDLFILINSGIFSSEVRSLKIYYESVKQIYHRIKTTQKCLPEIEDIFIKNITGFNIDDIQDEEDSFIYRALDFYVEGNFDKAKMYLEKSAFHYQQTFLYHFLQFVLYERNSILFINNLISSFKPKYFDLFAYVISKYIRETKSINNIGLILDIFEKSKKIMEFTDKQIKLMGLLYLLNGDLDESRKYLNKDIFSNIYTRNKFYIDSYVAVKNKDILEAYTNSLEIKNKDLQNYKNEIEALYNKI